MTAEIITGAVQGAALAAGEAMKAPVAAAVGMRSIAASVPSVVTPVVQAAAVTVETTSTVAKGLEGVKTIAQPFGQAFNAVSESTSLASRLSAVAQNGGSHNALTTLAFGDMAGRMPDVAANLPDNILRQDFIDLERLGPEAVQGLTKEVEGLQLVKDLVDNPEFLSAFAEEFGKDVAAQKALMKDGKLTGKEYMAMRQSMLERSAEKASSGQPKEKKEPEMNEKELERIKREAALQAIRQHMQQWRLSVKMDRRLTQDAKQNALKRIDVFEQKILIKEVMKWDGVLIVTLIAMATVWMQEAAA